MYCTYLEAKIVHALFVVNPSGKSYQCYICLYVIGSGEYHQRVWRGQHWDSSLSWWGTRGPVRVQVCKVCCYILPGKHDPHVCAPAPETTSPVPRGRRRPAGEKVLFYFTRRLPNLYKTFDTYTLKKKCWIKCNPIWVIFISQCLVSV